MRKIVAAMAVLMVVILASSSWATPITVGFDAGGNYTSRMSYYDDPTNTVKPAINYPAQSGWISTGQVGIGGNPGIKSWNNGVQVVQSTVYDVSSGGCGSRTSGGSVPYNMYGDQNGIPSAVRGATALGPMLDTMFVYSYYGAYNIACRFDVGGLNPDATYDLEIWSWHPNGGPSFNLYGASGLLGTVVTSNTPAASATDDTGKTTFLGLTADGEGTVYFTFTANNSLKINGFRLTEQVEIPEPATLLLVGTGALGVFGYARRRMMK